MTTRRTAAALGAVALLATVGLSACATSGASTDPSSFANVSGSAVPVKDELTALCKQIVTQALPVDAATALAESSGYTARVIKIDGADQAATKDLRDDRMNFEVEKDIVTACTVG